MENNILKLNDKLLYLLSERRNIKNNKTELIKKQNYEKAAVERDKEKRNIEKIFQVLSEDLKYDFYKSKQAETDIMTILDLVQDGDADLTNAINKLEVMDLERLQLMKDIENYNLNQITLDELHKRINTSFEAVRQDFKNKIRDKVDKVFVEFGPSAKYKNPFK